MAQPSTELMTYRSMVTRMLDGLYREVQAAIDIVEGTGATDQERRAFFDAWISQQQDYDIDTDDLIASVQTMRALRAYLETNMVTLAKMRI